MNTGMPFTDVSVSHVLKDEKNLLYAIFSLFLQALRKGLGKMFPDVLGQKDSVKLDLICRVIHFDSQHFYASQNESCVLRPVLF